MSKFLSARYVYSTLLTLGFIQAFTLQAHAQAVPLTKDELRPLTAMATDIAEGRQLAETTCAKCHGLDGVSTTKNVPHLAGQRPSYLFVELKNYKRGLRSNGDMAEKVKFLSDDALVKASAYYASLEPVIVSSKTPLKMVDPIAAGKTIAAPCSKCHGESGISQKSGVPNLIGLDPKYLVETMKAYKSDDRKFDKKDEEMGKLLAALSDAQLDQVALYYGLKSKDLSRANTANITAPAPGKELLGNCIKCHGEDGIGTSPASPSIAGQDAQYMLKALKEYKDNTRDDDVMSPRAKKLSEDELKSLVAYFSALAPKAPLVIAPLTTMQWVEKCDHCHGNAGNSVRPNVPALAGQRIDYLEAVMKAYRTGERKSSEMAAMSGILTDEDIGGLAAYYAAQKARAFVFVTVSDK